MEQGFLEEIGLTKGEIRIYLSLLSIGQTTSGPIISESGISSSKVYEILEKLMAKGLVSYAIKNKTKYFQATSPLKLKDYLLKKEERIDKQKEALEKNLPTLMAKFEENKILQDAEIFNGAKAVKAMLWDVVADAKKGESYYFFSGQGEGYREANIKVYRQYAQYRSDQGLNVKGIIHSSLKDLFGYMKTIKNTSFKFVNFPTPANIGIFRDKVFMMSWTENPVGFLITSEEISNQFKNFFEATWKIAKK